MPSQGAVVIVSGTARPLPPPELAALDLSGRIDTTWDDVHAVIETTAPAAVIATAAVDTVARLDALAAQLASLELYVPLIAIGAAPPYAANVLPFARHSHDGERLKARLRAALRVRSLHGTVLRRLAAHPMPLPLPLTDPLHDASVLLMGRGACFPALSVALGVRLGVVGALSIDAAARHLNVRDVDGIVIGDGFTRRVVDGFLGVLGDDVRFRNLPVLVSPATVDAAAHYALPYLEFAPGSPDGIAERAAPLLRLHAFEARLTRMLKVIDADGLLDPRTGLLTASAFDRDLAAAANEAQAHGAALALVRLALDTARSREQIDAARIVSRLMRRSDFASLRDDGAIVIAFAGAGATNASQIGQRLASVLRYSVLSTTTERRTEVRVASALLQPGDSAATLMARVADHAGNGRRAAS